MLHKKRRPKQPKSDCAVHLSFEIGAKSQLEELGMDLWASDGPWAGRRLAAVHYVSDANGAPLPVGWGWTARALEFARPNPLICSISRGTPAPIPTNAEAEKQQKNLEKDLDTPIGLLDSRGPSDTPPDTRTPTRGDQTIPEDPYFLRLRQSPSG